MEASRNGAAALEGRTHCPLQASACALPLLGLLDDLLLRSDPESR